MIVSFIIVAYNASKTLHTILNDLILQDYELSKIEVILIDGNSEDNTKKIMLDFCKKNNLFNRIIVLDNPQRTLPCGWNIALKAAKGDIYLRVDAHASIPTNFISKNVETIISGQEICGGKVISITDDITPWKITLAHAENSMFGGSVAQFRRLEIKKYVNTLAFAAYKKDVFEKVGYYDERLSRTEDNEIHYRMKKAGFRFYYNPEIRSYRHTRSSLSKLIKQKYLNGYWVGLTLSVCLKCFSVYHIIPFGFVIAIIITTAFSFYGFWKFAFLLWISYFLITFIMTIMSFVSNKIEKYDCLLPVLFLTLHLSYGLGTLVGLLKIPLWKSSLNKKL